MLSAKRWLLSGRWKIILIHMHLHSFLFWRILTTVSKQQILCKIWHFIRWLLYYHFNLRSNELTLCLETVLSLAYFPWWDWYMNCYCYYSSHSHSCPNNTNKIDISVQVSQACRGRGRGGGGGAGLPIMLYMGRLCLKGVSFFQNIRNRPTKWF